jgi:hypothetical protein
MPKDYITKNYKKEINYKNDFELAISLVNILYQNIKREKQDYDYSSPSCVEKILKEQGGQICQGFQLTADYLLKAFDIPCRMFSIWSKLPLPPEDRKKIINHHEKMALLEVDIRKPDYVWNLETNLNTLHGHALNEFYYDNKWHIIDPTFNCLYQFNDKYIDSPEFKKIVNQGGKITYKYFYDLNESIVDISEFPIPIEIYRNVKNIREQ